MAVRKFGSSGKAGHLTFQYGDFMEKPILFTGPMVRAIIEGKKTQTRRVIKMQPPVGRYQLYRAGQGLVNWILIGDDGQFVNSADQPVFRKPYEMNDRLWVRETWRPESDMTESAAIYYKADGFRKLTPESKDKLLLKPNDRDGLWRPSIFMPRWASRITLEITGVRVERVQEIGGEDAIREGVDRTNTSIYGYAIQRYQKLWDSINKKRGYGWDLNPWVWAIEFKVVEAK